MIKHSRQRDAILLNLSQRCDHPTAETIYLDIKEQIPNISLGTVYRNLSLLADLGEIQKITTGDGPDRFDGCAKPHYHFCCRSCHEVLDLPLIEQDSINQAAAKVFPGIIQGSITHFFGLCPKCAQKENK